MNASAYNPQLLGAQCHLCPLGPHTSHFCPVPPEENGSDVVVLAQNPGNEEVEEGRPLVGRSGHETMDGLERCGVGRLHADWNNAILCMPPFGELTKLLKRIERENSAIRRENKQRKKDGLPELDLKKTPMECCAPRLYNELKGKRAVFAMGRHAAAAVIPYMNGGILEIRGTLNEVLPEDWPEGHPMRANGAVKVMPIVNAAYVLRSPFQREAFQRDLSRGTRWFRGELKWEPPEVIYRPSVDEIARHLSPDGPLGKLLHFWDTETTGLHPMRERTRCIGIGNMGGTRGILIPFEALDGSQTFTDGQGVWFLGYSPEEQLEISELLLAWATNPKILKTGHNSRVYDLLILETHFKRLGLLATDAQLRIEPSFDTLAIHAVAEPMVPHNLGFVGSFFSDVHNWKGDHTAVGAKNDRELSIYCAEGDVGVTGRVVKPVLELLDRRGQRRVLKTTMGMQDVAVGLHRVGMLIDQKKAAEWNNKLSREASHWENRTRRLISEYDDPEVRALASDFNPHSPHKVRALAFDTWDLLPLHWLKPAETWTETEERSTADPVMIAHIGDAATSEEQREILKSIRHAKKRRKLQGTYLKRVLVAPERGWQPVLDWRKGGSLPDPTFNDCVLYEDGRVHASWNACGTNVGRLSCGGRKKATEEAQDQKTIQPVVYNLLNVSRRLRDMFIPAEGRVYVYSDMDSLHLHLIACRWQIPSLLRAYAEDLDAHAAFCESVWGDEFINAPGHPGHVRRGAKFTDVAKKMRGVGKTGRFIGAYGASEDTLHRGLQKTQDDEYNLLYADMKPEFVYDFYDKWMTNEPEWKSAWTRELDFCERNGFVEEHLLGRRLYFPWDAMDRSKVTNTPILFLETAIMNSATIELCKAIPFEYAGPGTGLVNQNYDSVMFEVPEEDAERVGHMVFEVLNRSVPGLEEANPTADVGIGRNWAEASGGDSAKWAAVMDRINSRTRPT